MLNRVVNQKRHFGTLLVDPFKYILTHFDAFLKMLLVYNFIPVLVIASSYVFFTREFSLVRYEAYIAFFEIAPYIFTPIFIMHIALLSASILLESIKQKATINVMQRFKQMYKRNLRYHIFLSFCIFLLCSPALILFLFLKWSVVGFIYLGVLGLLVLFFGFSLYGFSYMYYLEHEDASLRQSFSKGFKYLKESWLKGLGLIMVSGVIFSFMTNVMFVPLSLLFLLSNTFISNSDERIEFISVSLTILISALALSILTSYLITVLNLFYFDVIEHQEERNLRERIRNIAIRKNKLFNNEGNF